MEQRDIKIRDLRRKEKYQLDDEYLNGYARLCGVFATAVYNSLCRHSDKYQECFPSLELIMEEHGIQSKHTVIKAIKKLEEWGIVQVKREKDERTKRQLKNVYILTDKSEWKQKPGAYNTLGAGCISCTEPGAFHAQKPGAPRALEGYTEEKDTHIKDIYSEMNSQVKEIMDIFYTFNPSLNFGNMTVRKAAERMIKKYGFEETKRMAAAIKEVQGRPYAPVATTPYQMEQKLAAFKIYFDREKQTGNTIG